VRVADPEPEQIRVVIADDHPVVRQGLRTFLESREGITVVGEAATGQQAVARVARLRPDVVLIDLVMPELDGLEAITRIRARDPDVKIIVLTSFAGDDQVLPAVRAGACGYLLKDVEPAELERAIRAAHQGHALLDPAVTAQVLREVTRPRPADRLTPRERQVLALLGEGRSNREIARALVVTEKTVKTHVSNILAKLGLADRTQAAIYAVREHLTDR
jgi:NarL family two-component system response regulator LiaR